MKDFGLRIDDVAVDKYSQDNRILKMKLWLHFTDMLKPHRRLENDMQLVDVTVTSFQQPEV
jgi:hypothetical protein